MLAVQKNSAQTSQLTVHESSVVISIQDDVVYTHSAFEGRIEMVDSEPTTTFATCRPGRTISIQRNARNHRRELAGLLRTEIHWRKREEPLDGSRRRAGGGYHL